MKAALITLAVLVAVVLLWIFVIDTTDESLEFEGAEPEDFPARFDEVNTNAGQAEYVSGFSELAFEYPDNWNETEGANNDASSQLLTVESPLDINEFYFCLDLYAVDAEADDPFTVAEAEVLAVENMEDENNHSVIYTVDGIDGLQWGVSDEEVEVGDTSFDSEVTNSDGERLQVLGRFNCREDTKPDLTIEEFQDANWFHEARGIINSLEF